ncbi:unnamed protein product [Peniophora sp. CBMAI 1063]|nr:unnamed protein product [Peniophora sp. CBMAI 1063]
MRAKYFTDLPTMPGYADASSDVVRGSALNIMRGSGVQDIHRGGERGLSLLSTFGAGGSLEVIIRGMGVQICTQVRQCKVGEDWWHRLS